VITGGGSKFGATLTQQLLNAGYFVHLVTSNPDAWANTNNLKTIPVNWHELNLYSIKQCIPSVDQIDLVFFNHNASSLSQEKFKKFTIQDCKSWQQSYFVACQFPFYLVHALSKKLHDQSKIVWMLSDLIKHPKNNQIGFSDYIGNKFTNACLMKAFSQSFPACFFGIYPDGDGFSEHTSFDNKAQDIVQLINSSDTNKLNGNIFSTQGNLLELHEQD